MLELLQQGKQISQKEALDFFGTLEAIQIDELVGEWRGKECKTGHPMEGLLHQLNWYGKQFFANGNAHPLVFQQKDGRLFNLNPNFIPSGFPLVRIPSFLARSLIKIFHPLLSTRKTKARIQMVEYHGKVSAAMIYDRIAIIDHFRKIDQNTVLGVMDYKGKPNNRYYFFLLEREQKNR